MADCLLFDSNITEIAVTSGQYDSYGSLRPKGLVSHLGFDEVMRAKCAMCPKQSLEGVLFGRKISMSEGDPVVTFSKHSHQSDCIFRL